MIAVLEKDGRLDGRNLLAVGPGYGDRFPGSRQHSGAEIHHAINRLHGPGRIVHEMEGQEGEEGPGHGVVRLDGNGIFKRRRGRDRLLLDQKRQPQLTPGRG
jgi:hypothetical protein